MPPTRNSPPFRSPHRGSTSTGVLGFRSASSRAAVSGIFRQFDPSRLGTFNATPSFWAQRRTARIGASAAAGRDADGEQRRAAHHAGSSLARTRLPPPIPNTMSAKATLFEKRRRTKCRLSLPRRKILLRQLRRRHAELPRCIHMGSSLAALLETGNATRSVAVACSLVERMCDERGLWHGERFDLCRLPKLGVCLGLGGSGSDSRLLDLALSTGGRKLSWLEETLMVNGMSVRICIRATQHNAGHRAPLDRRASSRRTRLRPGRHRNSA